MLDKKQALYAPLKGFASVEILCQGSICLLLN